MSGALGVDSAADLVPLVALVVAGFVGTAPGPRRTSAWPVRSDESCSPASEFAAGGRPRGGDRVGEGAPYAGVLAPDRPSCSGPELYGLARRRSGRRQALERPPDRGTVEEERLTEPMMARQSTIWSVTAVTLRGRSSTTSACKVITDALDQLVTKPRVWILPPVDLDVPNPQQLCEPPCRRRREVKLSRVDDDHLTRGVHPDDIRQFCTSDGDDSLAVSKCPDLLCQRVSPRLKDGYSVRLPTQGDSGLFDPQQGPPAGSVGAPFRAPAFRRVEGRLLGTLQDLVAGRIVAEWRGLVSRRDLCQDGMPHMLDLPDDPWFGPKDGRYGSVFDRLPQQP